MMGWTDPRLMLRYAFFATCLLFLLFSLLGFPVVPLASPWLGRVCDNQQLALVVKQVDTADLKSAASRNGACRFEPGPGHHKNAIEPIQDLP